MHVRRVLRTEETATGGRNRPPCQKDAGIADLFGKAQAIYREIGKELLDMPLTGGGSDGNFTAALGIPTLDGLGGDGKGAHAAYELAEADVWFRLGARSAPYNNTQVRAHIEPALTTAELDKVKKRVAAWHDLNFAEMKATPVTIPGKEGQSCPPMPMP